MIRLLVLALALGALISGPAGAQPKAAPVTDKQMERWVAKALELAPEDREAAFRAKMGELNAKLDTNTIKVVSDKDGVVREVRIPTTYTEDIRPVAVFRDLEKLHAYGVGAVCKVADVSCLRGLTRLKELNITFTAVADISALAELPLERLWFDHTAVKDVRALKKMPLTAVGLPEGVPAAQLTVLTGKPLREFSTPRPGPDSAKEVKAIFGNAKLECYRVGKSNLESLEPFAAMPLKLLYLGDAPKLKSLAPLKDCGTLDTVVFAHAPLVTDLKPLAGKPLTQLGVAYCPGVRDLAPVKDMPKLTTLILSGCGVTDLAPVTGYKNLVSLWIESLQVKSLKPIADLPALACLYMHGAGTADKDFTPITKLPALQLLLIDVTPATAPLVKKIPSLQVLNGKNVALPK